MAAFGERMSRFLLLLILVGQLASIIECSNGRDPDDYDDLDDDDEVGIIFEEDDTVPSHPGANDRPNTDERLPTERYYKLFRPRLGHFERYPELRKLYEDYFDKSLKRRDKTMEEIDKTEDWRYLRPTPDSCISFLNMFKSKKYMINKPIDIIPLDACLEWLFLDEITVQKDHPDYERQERAVGERELDLRQTQSSYTLSNTEILRQDETLESIYRDTLFGVPDEAQQVDGKRVVKEPGVPRRMRLKLKKYLLRLLDINDQNPGKGCHSLWLDAYTSFMEQVYVDCNGQSNCVHFGDERLDEDRYFRLVAESTRQSSIKCYKIMQKSILSLMRSSYNSKAGPVLLTKAKLLGKLGRHHESQKWSREMVKILQLVSGQEDDKPISLGEVVRTLWNIKSGDDDESNRFLKALGDYSIANADMNSNGDDPQGTKRYARAIIRLCKPYIDEKLFLANAGAIDLNEEEIKNKEPFLFYHLIYSLIRLTNHESIYDITKDQFELDVLDNKWEALYLTTFACQMMSTTTGELSQDTNENAYDVTFSIKSVQYMQDWPLEIMNQNLVKVAGKPDQSATVEPTRTKFDFRAKVSRPTQQDNHEADNGAVAAAAIWSDDEDDDDNNNNKGRNKVNKDKSSSSTSHGESISSRLKKTFGRFKFGGSSSSSHTKKSTKKEFMMSEEQIRMFHDSFGRWPDLPPNIHYYYPNLPADCVKKQEAEPVGLKALVDLQPQKPSVVRSAVPPVGPVGPTGPAGPAEPREIHRPSTGYWPTKSDFSKDDGLPTWGHKSEPEPRLPPRRDRNNMF